MDSTEEVDEETAESVLAPTTDEVMHSFVSNSVVESDQPKVVDDNPIIVCFNSILPRLIHASSFNAIPPLMWTFKLSTFYRPYHFKIVNVRWSPRLSLIAPALLYFGDKFRSSHRKFVRLKCLHTFISYFSIIPLWCYLCFFVAHAQMYDLMLRALSCFDCS